MGRGGLQSSFVSDAFWQADVAPPASRVVRGVFLSIGPEGARGSDDPLALRAQHACAERHHVAALEENFGAGFMPSPTPCGVPVITRSPGSKRHELAQVGDDLRHREDHVGRAALAACSSPLTEPARSGIALRIRAVRRLVTSHGPIGPEAVEALALAPLAVALDLPVALGDVVGQAIGRRRASGHRMHRRRLRASVAHHEAQLDLPVAGN